MACRLVSQNQKLFPIRSIRNHKILSSTKNLQGQIFRGSASKEHQLWSLRQRAGTGTLTAIHRRSSTRLGCHNCNLCERHSYSSDSQKPYRSISAFTRKPFQHPEMAKKMENHINGTKSLQVTFTIHGKTCPLILLNGLKIPHAEDARYLGLHLGRRLNWRNITTKRIQLGI